MKKFKSKSGEIVYTGVEFPIMNKNNSMYDNNKAMRDYGISYERCIVRQTLLLSLIDYLNLKTDLLNDYPRFNKIGGTSLLKCDPRYAEFKAVPDKDAIKFLYGENNIEYMKSHGFKEVTKVYCTWNKKFFFVNTEGYNYARYCSAQYQEI